MMRRLSDRKERAEVGSRMRLAREMAGYRNADLSKMIDITPSRLTSWENGDAMPNTPRLWRALVEALGVTCDYLLLDKTDGLTREVFVKLSRR